MNKKKNTGFVVLIVILSILVVGLASYIIYDKFVDTNESQNNNVEEELSDKDNNEIINERKGQVLNTKIGTIIISENGDVYYAPYEKWAEYEDYELNFDEKDEEIIGHYKTYVVTNYIHDIYSEADKNFKGYKIPLNNIKYAYEFKFGQDVNISILFINDKGQVSELFAYNVGQTSKTNVILNKNIGDFKNIVNIVSNYDSMKLRTNAILIDAYGNEYIYEGNLNY